MWRFLKAAFLVRPEVPFLGNVPVLALGALAIAALGFLHPGIWLLGAGAIGSAVVALSTSPRFRKLVDARDLAERSGAATDRRRELVGTLNPGSLERLASIQHRCRRVLDLYRTQNADEVLLQTSTDALDKLQWLYLRLLLSHQTLSAHDADASERTLRAEVARIQRDLGSERLTPTLRASLQATLELLTKRLESAAQRQTTLDEIESDLRRIETQVDLALDEATLNGRPVAISTNIDFASRLLDAGAFGSSAAAIADIDREFDELRDGLRA